MPHEINQNDVEVSNTGRDGHTIRVASRITGLSVDTLRMWERRYGFPVPSRNSVGNRIYSESDVTRLGLIAKAMKMGYRAGEAIRLEENDLVDLLAGQTQGHLPRTSPTERDIEPLIDRITSYDPDGFRRELRRLAGSFGTQGFITNIVAKLVEVVGDAWAKGAMSIHQEHLMTDIVSTELRLMGSLLDNPLGPKLLFATFPREFHGLGLQMVGLYAQFLGAQGYVLGTDTPVLEIARAASSLSVQAVAISVSTASPTTAVIDHISHLAQLLPTSVELWLGGQGALTLEELPHRVRSIRNWNELELAVSGLRRGL